MSNIKSLFRIISQLGYIMTKKQKKNSVIVFFTMLIGSGLELLGVSIIYPFLQLMINEEAFQTRWYLRWIFKFSPKISYSRMILFLCVFIICIYVVKNIVMMIFAYIQNKNSAQFQRETSTLLLESIMKRPYEYFVNNSSELIMQHIHGDTFAAYGVLMNLYNLASNIFTVILIGAFLLYADWIIATAALILAFSCFFIIVIGFKKKLKEYGIKMITLSAEQSKVSHEAIFGIKEISVLGRRKEFVGRYSDKSVEVEKISVMNGFLSACPPRVIEGICIGGFIGIASVRIMLGDNPVDFIPTLGAFAMGAFKILPSISSMSGQINGIVFNQARLGNCYENLKEAEKFEAEQATIVVDSDIRYNSQDVIAFKNCIEVRGISWTYFGSQNSVINNLSLVIKKNETIALVGASGAGKTTLGDILLGLFKPQIGQILMDGIDISTIPNTWSRLVGYVPQSVFLTDDTIRANVAFGLKKEEIDDNRVWSALDQAQLADYISSLPKGLDTGVGERGVRFSGGQRQRIAIARALYTNPEILILDEATSALDTDTETAVMESIDALLGQKTLVIIAHRLTTIKNCDRVFEIKNGKAIERDKNDIIPDNLMK